MLIAGVRIVTVWLGLTPRADCDKCYEDFVVDAFSERPDIRIEVHPLSLAPFDLSGYIKIFDSEQAWSLYRGEHEYLLSLDPPSQNQGPALLARLNPDATRVTVFLNTAEGIPDDPVRYPLDQLLLVHHLAGRAGLLLHAAGAAFGGAALVFPGKSRAGKSTLSRQLQSDQRIELLSDDRIIVRNIDGAFQAFGTPWPGDAGIAKNSSAPLRSLLFLNHSAENRIEPISPQKALENLLPVTSIPWYEKHLLSEVLDTCEELLNRIPGYNLYFRPDSSVVDLIHDFANHQNLA